MVFDLVRCIFFCLKWIIWTGDFNSMIWQIKQFKLGNEKFSYRLISANRPINLLSHTNEIRDRILINWIKNKEEELKITNKEDSGRGTQRSTKSLGWKAPWQILKTGVQPGYWILRHKKSVRQIMTGTINLISKIAQQGSSD